MTSRLAKLLERGSTTGRRGRGRGRACALWFGSVPRPLRTPRRPCPAPPRRSARLAFARTRDPAGRAAVGVLAVAVTAVRLPTCSL